MDSAAQTLRDDPPTPDRWPPPGDTPNADLTSLRAELDQLDDAIHDLLIRRAEVVQRVAATKPHGRRRSTARAGGCDHPPAAGAPSRRPAAAAIIRIWRELLAATTGMQGRFAIAVCDTDPARAFTQLAREHFGALTPLTSHRSPAQAIAEVSAGRAPVAVLPLPSDDRISCPRPGGPPCCRRTSRASM